MKNRITKFSVGSRAAVCCSFFGTGVTLFTCLGAGGNSYPHDFRNWVHVKSAIITSSHPAAHTEGGIHHIYANPKAIEGYASGQFTDGSAIVYELLEANEKDGVISEGARHRVDWMMKDSVRYQATGGWGFERFKAAGEVNELGGSAPKGLLRLPFESGGTRFRVQPDSVTAVGGRS